MHNVDVEETLEKLDVEYYGIDDNVDKTMLYIADSITTRILPNPQEFVETKAVLEQGKIIIVVEVKKGNNLCYIKKFGRSASGCYVRIGTSARSMTEEQIEKAYIKILNISKITMVDKRSRRQDLTFNEFKSIITFKGTTIQIHHLK